VNRRIKVEITTVAEGVLFGEGPTWCDDGTVVCTAVASGTLHRIWPGEGRVEVLATTGGGPNACAPTSGGGFLVTQNGGIDFSLHAVEGFEAFPPPVPRPPGIQAVSATGQVVELVTHTVDRRPFRAPNDLVVTADGSLYFTDPGHFPLPAEPAGAVMRMARDGTVTVVAEPFHYCNGIALDHEGQLLVVEAGGIQVLEPDGATRWLIEDVGGPADGMAVDVTGTIYACCPAADRIQVISGGAVVSSIDFAPGSMPTNCCFGGADGRTLFVTVSLAKTVVAITGLPEPGVPVHPWTGRTTP
jgi:gluconolactonase